MLSTTDNPFNPWTHYDQWFDWDTSRGYNTASYLATVVQLINANGRVSDDEALALAIDDILEFNITGNYVLVPEPKELA